MNEERSDVSDNARKAVIDLLHARSRKARFITEVCASLQRSNVRAEDVERALSDLEAEGLVMIRDHYCGDPHLVGVDLRIVALMESAEGEDPQTSAIREIDTAWDKWLADYLSNHRCS
jgi:hypothetical protein